jgi:predicted nucleotidyltransferase
MVDLVREKLDRIAELCAQFHVRKLELFGSATGDRFNTETSDVDFLVEFGDVPPGEHADCYFGMLFGLEDLFGRHIDLVSVKTISNPYFREAIDQQREVVYACEEPQVPV